MLAWFLFVPIALVLYVPIGAILLRASVGIANRILGATNNPPGVPSVEHFGGVSEVIADESNPFAPPTTQSTAVNRSREKTDAIPEPRFGSACVIVLAAGVLSAVAAILVGFIGGLGQVKPMMIQFNSQAVSFGISVLIYTTMLPTTAGRAALIYLIQIAIAVLVGVVVGGIFAAIYLMLGA